MWRLLTDYARRRSVRPQPVADDLDWLFEVPVSAAPGTYLDLHRSLEQLQQLDPLAYDIVLLRHFAGLTIAETAESLDTSPMSVKRRWAFAKSWLHKELK